MLLLQEQRAFRFASSSAGAALILLSTIAIFTLFGNPIGFVPASGIGANRTGRTALSGRLCQLFYETNRQLETLLFHILVKF